jgi:hypothetical protein
MKRLAKVPSRSGSRDFIMMKNVLLALTLMSVALWTGCATGGGGHTGGNIHVTVTSETNFVAVTLTDQFTATVEGTSDHAVTWSLAQNGGGACTGNPNPCGTIDANGLYTAPPVAIQVVVTATLVSDSTKSGSAALNVAAVTVLTTPKLNDNSLNVVKGTSQLFTATAGPDDKRVQTFNWNIVCDAGPNLCGTITFDPKASYSAVYVASSSIPNPAVAHITATSTIDPTVSDTVDVTIVKNRLLPNGTYAFHLSGFDASGPIAVAGNLLTDANGAISTGTEDELTISAQATRIINSGSVTLDSNAHGVLALQTSAGTRSYKVVFNTAGDGQMIEFDGTGRRGSGELRIAKAKFNNTSLPLGSTFAFGMTGIDTVSKRTAIAGLFQPDGAGAITFGMIDINDFGTPTSSSNVTGIYDVAANGRGTMSLTNNDTGKTYHYAFYMVSGQANKAANPLTMFVISTDGPLISPAVAGTIVTQDTGQVYDNSALNDFSISNLTGTDTTSGTKTLVSLTDARGDGKGKFIGTIAANNGGTIVAADPNKPFTYNYNFTSGAHGRYTIDLLGDPNANPVVPPVHFVLYLNAANRGFLVDGSSPFVYTGTMNPASASNPRAAQLAGSLEAVTGNSGTSSVAQTASSFQFVLLPPTPPFTGTRDETDGGQTQGQVVAGTFAVNSDSSGSITFSQPPAENYVIYVLDNPKSSENLIQHFVMIEVDKIVTNPAVIFGER